MLEETADGAGKLARRLPVVGYALSAATDTYAIAHGESPGKVITSEAAGILGGIAVGAGVVAFAGLVGVGPPVIAVAALGAGAGVIASLGAEYAWDHWVPAGAKTAIDDGLKNFGHGAADVAEGFFHAVTPW